MKLPTIWKSTPYYRNSIFSDKYLIFSLAVILFGICNCMFAQSANEGGIELPVAEQEDLPSIFLIGDSTVRNGSGDGSNGQWGWGSYLSQWFQTDKVNIVNRALGARSTRTYITQGYWEKQKKLMKTGDYVLIQFGHNDASPINDNRRARGVLDGIDDNSVEIFNELTKKDERVFSYGQYLRIYLSDIREAGAIPIICSPVPTNGPIIEKLSQYAEWAKQVAKTEGVGFLDLNKIISESYSEFDAQSLNRFFVDDKVHYTEEGATFTSKLVVSALKGLNNQQITNWLNEGADKINPWISKIDNIDFPVVRGYGEGLFRVDTLVYANHFVDDSDWLIQIEKTESPYQPRIDYFNRSLEMIMPGRGATIWNKNKFSGNLVFTYKVQAPSTYVDKLGIVVRDINTFWHASHPGSPDQLFNSDLYTGAFPSYHSLLGFYASIGGRDNTTTRFRRYPRKVNDEPVSHIALTDKDGLIDHLIKQDQLHTIQVVIFEDIVQYIVDGKVFYEIKEGDTVQVINANGETEEVTYQLSAFPTYKQGWFGFRMVNTHHIFSDFRVYRLVPDSN